MFVLNLLGTFNVIVKYLNVSFWKLYEKLDSRKFVCMQECIHVNLFTCVLSVCRPSSKIFIVFLVRQSNTLYAKHKGSYIF